MRLSHVNRGRLVGLMLLLATSLSAAAAFADSPSLSMPGNTFTSSSHYVSTTVFSWFDSTGGQQSGPWRPVEGRANWTGEVPFWESQLKQMMAANIDVMQVTLMPLDHTAQRGNLFQAMSNLRTQGYNVPKVVPFLDTNITSYYGWVNPQADGTSPNKSVNLSTTAGKDAFVNQYVQFYQQYYSVNTDVHADSYLAQIDGRVVMDSWHFFGGTPDPVTHETSLTASEMRTRLQAGLAGHALFNNLTANTGGTGANGIYMINSAMGTPLSFAAEILPQFESTQYIDYTAGNRAATVKPGYWDQNVRNPGSILQRNGGTGYTGAWTSVQADKSSGLNHVNVESWNEYDEGSGIYAANPGAPYRTNGNTSNDTWSATNDPNQYITTTAAGAADFNDVVARAATILANGLPSTMQAGETKTFQVVVRNDGDLSWTDAAGFKFGEVEFADPTMFGPGRYLIDDNSNEIPTFGGIFRGRPITFDVTLTAPTTPGVYTTHWSMVQEGVAWFGSQLTIPITVTAVPEPSTAILLVVGLVVSMGWVITRKAQK